jgi:hypothetical protein
MGCQWARPSLLSVLVLQRLASKCASQFVSFFLALVGQVRNAEALMPLAKNLNQVLANVDEVGDS